MKKDEIVANGKWEFDKNVTDCFDDMLSRSIPDYNTMRDLTLRVAEPFLNNIDFSLLDIGCSNGINLELFMNKYKHNGNYTGIDNSLTMIENAKDRLNKFDDVDISLICDDILDVPISRYSFNIITSILTIQFVPVEYRPLLLNRIYSALKINGVFIFVEKILQSNQAFNQIFVDSYYNIKRDNGYSENQIMTKKKALEGVLVPYTHESNIELLKSAGFKYIDTFWKCLNFEGYIAIKGEM